MDNDIRFWDYKIEGARWRIASVRNAVVMVMPVDAPKALDRAMMRLHNHRIILEHTAATDRMAQQLEEYFSGKRKEFDVDINLLGSDFERRVWGQLINVGYGEMITYGELAHKCGCPNGARAVGGAVGRNPLLVVVPCHRVLAANGYLGGFAAGLPLKKKLLLLEQDNINRNRTENSDLTPEFPF